DFSIRPKLDVVAAMPHAAAGAEKLGDFVELSRALGIAKAKERLGVVRVGVKSAKCIEKSATFQQCVVNHLDFGDLTLVDRQSEQSFFLFSDGDATLRIEGHRDPRILSFLRRSDQLRLESFGKNKSGWISRLVLVFGLCQLPTVISIVRF